MAKEYIERDAAIKYLEIHKKKAKENNFVLCANEDSIIAFLRNKCPTADVVEVKRGHWIEDEVCVYACSECGFTFTSADDISEFKFCRCGAKMNGKE